MKIMRKEDFQIEFWHRLAARLEGDQTRTEPGALTELRAAARVSGDELLTIKAKARAQALGFVAAGSPWGFLAPLYFAASAMLLISCAVAYQLASAFLYDWQTVAYLVR